MNCTGCPNPELFCSDGVYREASPLECDTSLPGYYVYLFATFTLKLLSTLRQTSLWCLRNKGKRKLPIGPINSLLFIAVLLVQIVLVGLDVVNFVNGASFVLYSVIFLQFAWIYSFGLIQLVRLGQKILPKNHQQSQPGFDKLAKFDGLGKSMVILQFSSLIAGSLVLIILSPILTGYESILARIGFGLKASFIYCCLSGYIYQFERCIRTIKAVQKSVDGVLARQSSTPKSGLNSAILKMRKNQLIHFCTAFPSTLVFTLLAAGVQASVWLVALCQLFEANGAFYFEFFIKKRPKNLEAQPSMGSPSMGSGSKASSRQVKGAVPNAKSHRSEETSSAANQQQVITAAQN